MIPGLTVETSRTIHNLLRAIGGAVEIVYVPENATDVEWDNMPWTVTLVSDPTVHSHASSVELALWDVITTMARKGIA